MQRVGGVFRYLGELLTGFCLPLEASEDTDFSGPPVPGSAPEVAVETSPAPSEGGYFADPTEWFLNEPQPLTAELIAELASSVSSISARSSPTRIQLAFDRGSQARLIRVGSLRYFHGDRCELANRCYVVLAGDFVDEPFFTWNLALHQRSVRTGPGGVFSRAAISHGFNSEAEARAFCLGAGLPGLAPLRE